MKGPLVSEKVTGLLRSSRRMRRCSGLRVSRSGMFAFLEQFFHGSVNHWAEGFHDVVSEAEGVVAAMMKDSQSGMEASRDQGAGDGGADDGVAVVEGVVEKGFTLRDPVCLWRRSAPGNMEGQ